MRTNRKRANSAGNGIDPAPLIERSAPDALRFCPGARRVAGRRARNIRLDYDRRHRQFPPRAEAARALRNKLLNAPAFALMEPGAAKRPPPSRAPASCGAHPFADRWTPLPRPGPAVNQDTPPSAIAATERVRVDTRRPRGSTEFAPWNEEGPEGVNEAWTIELPSAASIPVPPRKAADAQP